MADWSWRYEVDGDAEVKVDLAQNKNGVVPVSFVNKRTETNWLSGDWYTENWWNETGIRREDEYTDPTDTEND